MPISRAVTTFCLLLLTVAGAYASDETAQYRQLVINSLTAFSPDAASRWAYLLNNETGSGKTRLTQQQSYDPSKPEGNRWHLLKEYGKAPSDNRQAEYRDNKRIEEANRKKSPKGKAQQSLIDMIDLNSLELLSKSDEKLTFAFAPKLPNMNPDSLKKLTGLLELDKANAFVTRLKISNIDELKPAPGVTLSYFSMSFSFVEMDNIMLPQNITIDVKGKIDSGRPITQHSSETYSGYRRVPQPPAPPK